MFAAQHIKAFPFTLTRSLPGPTRQSIIGSTLLLMDARVKPGMTAV
jgi:hypothetical protein